MSGPSPQFEVVQLEPAGVGYVLPRRNLGRIRICGYLLLVAAIALGSYGIVLLTNACEAGFDLARFLPLSFLPYAAAALSLIACSSLFGRSEINLEADRLSAIERLGPFYWTFKRKTSDVTILEIKSIITLNGRSLAKSFHIEAAGIYLAFGYPYETCCLLAESIRQHWRIGQNESRSPQPPTIIGGSQYLFEDNNQPIVQPAQSKITITETDEQIALKIPPAGIWRGSNGAFFFSLFWNGFMALVTWLTVTGSEMEGPAYFSVWLVLALFWGIGIGLLFYAINLGRRTAAIVVAVEDLLIVQTGIFGIKRGQWNRREIAAILAVPSRSPHDESLVELQIRPRAGSKFSVLAGRNPDELRWVAAIIRRRLIADPETAESPEVAASNPL